MKFSFVLWTLPFISFVSGYFLLSYLYPVPAVVVPSIVGMTLNQALPVVTSADLNIRLLARKCDQELADGTIISQIPTERTLIKPHQTVYIVVSYKPPRPLIPDLTNRSEREVEGMLKTHGIRAKIYLQSHGCHPAGSCIGQFPPAGTLLCDEKALVYHASSAQKSVLLPNFKKKPVQHVIDFLDLNTIGYTLSHRTSVQKGHLCSDGCIVTDQRPLAYSIEHLSAKSLHMYLQVQHA